MNNLTYRTFKDKLFFYLICTLASLTVVPLFAIIWELIQKGYKQITGSFFTETAPSTLDAMLGNLGFFPLDSGLPVTGAVVRAGGTESQET